MRSMTSLVLAACAAVAISSQALAQSPATPPAGGTPEKIPFDIPYGTSIGLDKAKELLTAAEAEAKKHNWKMNIAVVGPSGDLVYFMRMDGAQIASVQISQDKAHAAATFRRPTKAFFDAVEGGHVYIAFLHGVVPSEGGFPLVEGGKLIGAIGCSGGTGAQDGVTCKVGADMVK